MSRNISTKIISLFLAFIMLFSVLPVQVFATGEGDVNTGSGENFTGGKKTAVGNWGSSSGKYHGMRFSLYFAEGNWGTYAEMKEAESRGEVTGFTQIGDIFETVITDTEGLLDGDCGTGINGVGIDYWSKKSAYDNMTWLYNNYNGTWDSIKTDRMDYTQANYGDIVQNINNFSWVVPSPTENSDVNDMSRSRTSQKFPTLFQKGQSATKWVEFFTGYKEITEENWDSADIYNVMTVVNEIIEGTGINITAESFKQGYYFDAFGGKHSGVFKLIFEPVISFKEQAANGGYFRMALTLRDLIAYAFAHPDVGYAYISDDGSEGVYKSIASAAYSPSLNMAHETFLVEDEPFMHMYAKQAKGDWYNNVLNNPDLRSSGGVGVITGYPRNDLETPEIVKTYVEISKVDSDGTVHYRKAAPTTIEKAEFYEDGLGNLTTLPLFEQIDYEDETRTAVLNDVFTTPHDLTISDSTEWVETDLITNAGVALQTTSSDIAGYKFGLVTGSEPFIEAVTSVTSVNDRLWTAYDKLQEYAENVVAQEGAFANESFKFLGFGDVTYIQTITNAVQYTHHMSQESALVRLTDEEIKNLEMQYNLSLVRAGIVDEETGQVVKVTEEYAEMLKQQTGTEVGLSTFANTTVLRYILKPAPKQVNIVKYYEKDWETGEISEEPYEIAVETPVDLDIKGTTVTILPPISQPPTGAEDPTVVKWVTNSTYPVIEIEDGELPEMSENGLTGTTPNPIPNYPQEPLTHNLYVEWKVIVPEKAPVRGSEDVPEWRLSKYIPSVVEDPAEGNVASATMSFTLSPDETWHRTTTFKPTGTYNYKIVNPNGRISNGTNTPANMNMETIGAVPAGLGEEYSGLQPNKWFHSRGFVYGGDSDSLSHDDTRTDMDLDANLNMIKSYDSGSITIANWLTGEHHTKNVQYIDSYALKSNNIPAGYSGTNTYNKLADLRIATYNVDTYEHKKTEYWHIPLLFGSICLCYRSDESFSPSSSEITYRAAKYNFDVSFARYVQENTDSRLLDDVEFEKDEQNGMTTIKYQVDDKIKVYPEIGMLFDTDNDEESIKWVIGDKARTIQPVVWQTLQHKVYVKPTSTGSSVATDSRGITKANSIGEAGKQIIYKGAGVNTNFRLYQSKDSNKVSLLTVKTYALDFNDSTSALAALKDAWGNSSYDSYSQHRALLKYLATGNNNKADITEKLLVDANPYSTAEFTGASKEQLSNSYSLVNYKNNYNATGDTNGEAVVFKHKLIIRGGAVIGIVMQDRQASSVVYKNPISITNLKSVDESLYNALVGMNLYDESGNRNNTVLSTFEHQPSNSKLLDEPKYASDLAAARLAIDGIATPATSAVKVNQSWYSEDTTVLIVCEYVSNFEVPSVSISDKLPMTISGTTKLNTPASKNEFFSELGKGYLYLKYNVDFKGEELYHNVEDFNAYFIYTSIPSDTYEFGEQKTNYLVPNVSITDTTRMN